MKSAGLQRLRFYCQMCEKQCRDANGFKCHTRTEAHLRQMSLFAQSSDSFVERFSTQFCDGYMGVLRRQGGRRVKANHVYTQYIADKEHVHMNATKWDTLSSFVSYLGKQRLADVTQDEYGDYFIQYIDRDPKAVARQLEKDGRASRERSREQQETERIQAEMDVANRLRAEAEQTAAERDGDGGSAAASSVEERQAEDEQRQREWLSADQSVTAAASDAPSTGRLTIALARHGGGGAQPSSNGVVEKKGAALFEAVDRQQAEEKQAASAAVGASGAVSGTRKRSAIDQLMHDEQQRKRQRAATTTQPPPSPSAPSSDAAWLSVGLVVKLLNRSVQGGVYYAQKGRITGVEDGGYTAIVAPLDSSLPAVRIDQSEVQTVIPAVGHTVRVVAGSRRRGQSATLCELADDQSSCTVQCVSDGELLAGMEFEHICKLSTD